MHELSLAQSIVDIAVAESVRAGCTRITAITVEVGVWSGVVREALEFALSATTQKTMAEGAEMIILLKEGRIRCNHCNTEYRAEDFYDQCPNCKSTSISIISGRELQVVSVTAE